MGSEIEPIKEVKKPDDKEQEPVRPNEDIVSGKPIATKQNDPGLEQSLSGAKKEAVDAGESSVHGDRLCALVKKLGTSFKSGRIQAESELAMELGKSPNAVTRFLKAGELAKDLNIQQACSRLLTKRQIVFDSQAPASEPLTDGVVAAEQPKLLQPAGVDPAFAPGLPISLRGRALHAASEIKAQGKLSPATQAALVQADKMGKLSEFCTTVNTKLVDSGVQQTRILDITAPGTQEGRRTIVLEVGAERSAPFNMVRPTTMPEALVVPLQERITAAIDECKIDGPGKELFGALNAAAFQGNLNEFREAFNNQAVRDRLPYRLKNNADGSSDGRQIIDVEQDGKVTRKMGIDLPLKAPNTVVIPEDVLAGRVTPEMVPFLKKLATVSERSKHRATAIDDIEQQGTAKELQSAFRTLDATAAVHETADPVEASRRMKALVKLSDEGNQLATSIVDQLSGNLGGTERRKDLLEKLNTGGSEALDALAQLKKNLPDAESKMDVLRLKAITQDLDSTSSAGTLDEALLYLENEKKYGNKLAPKAIEIVKTDRAALDLKDPAKWEAAIETIAGLAKTNPHARNLLAAIVASQDTSGQWQKLPTVRNENEYATRELPDMGALTPAQRDAMILKAVQGLKAVGDSATGICSSDAAALAIALRASVDKGETDTPLVLAVNETFANIQKKVNPATHWRLAMDQAIQTEAALNGIFAVTQTWDKSGTKGSAELAVLYTKLAASDNNRHARGGKTESGVIVSNIGEGFKHHIEELKEDALRGNPDAIHILGAVAGGVGRGNEHANRTEKDARGYWVPGNSLSVDASQALIKASLANPDVRALAMDILSSDRFGEVKDRGLRLCTLGTIAAGNPKDIPPKVHDALRAGLSDKESHQSAVLGMLALGPSLDAEDLRFLALRVQADTAPLLQTGAHKFGRGQGEQLCDELARRAVKPEATYDDRIYAVRALSALGTYHSTTNSLDVLKSFGGAKGAELINTLQGFPGGMEQKDKDGFTPAERFQNEAALALLDITERTTDPAAQKAAFNAFATSNWGKAFDRRMRMDEQYISGRLHNLMKNNPESVAIQHGVPKLLHSTYASGASPKPPLGEKCDAARVAAAFKDCGVKSPDEVLLRSAQLAIVRYGKDKIGQTLDKMALFNALPADTQRILSSFSGTLPEEATLPLSGRAVEAAVFNRLPDAERIKLFGSAAYMPEKANSFVPDLSQVMLTADQVGKLSDEQKRAIGLPEAPLPRGSAVSLRGATIDAKTFNGLAKEVKLAITGSDGNLEPGRELKDLSLLSIDAASFNGLDAPLKKSVSASSGVLDSTLVLRQLADGTIGDASSLTNILDQPLEQLVNEHRGAAQAKAKEELASLNALVECRKSAVKDMAKTADDGSGWFSKLYNSVSGDFTEHQKRFLTKQSAHIHNIQGLEVAIHKQQREVQLAQARVSLFDIAEANMNFVGAQREGKIREADLIAVATFGKYGREIFALAPDIAAEFRKNGQGMDANPFVRLNRTGDTQYASLPINFEIGKPPINGTLPELNKAATRGLEMLAGVKLKAERGYAGEPVLFSDAAIVRQEAFAGIAASPTMSKFNRLVEDIHTNLQTLDEQVRIMQNGGDRYEDFLKDANARGTAIQKAFNELTVDEKKYLYETRSSWRKALSDGSIKDPEARDELQRRCEGLEKGLQLFDRDAWAQFNPGKQKTRVELERQLKDEIPKIGGADKQPPDDARYRSLVANRFREGHREMTASEINHHYWRLRRDEATKQLVALNGEANQRVGIDKVLTYMASPEARDPSTFRRWLEHDGLELMATIGGAVLATAFVIATGGSGALLIAAAATAGGLVCREGMKEFQREVGIRNQGALVMEFHRGAMVPDGFGGERKMELVQDVVQPLLVDFVSETAMSFAGGKVGHFFGGYLSKVHGSLRTAVFGENKEAIARLAKNMAALKAAAQNDAWTMTFLKSTGRDSIKQPWFVGATVGSEEVMKQAAKDLSLQINKDDKSTAFLAIVVTSAVFRGMKPTYRAPKSAAAGDAVLSRNGVNEPDLRLSYEGTPVEVNAYMKGAKQRNSLIETTPDGFIETTANGARVEWTRRSSVARETTTIDLGKTAASLNEKSTPGQRTKPDTALGNPKDIKAQMEKMYEPIDAKAAELTKLEADYAKRYNEYGIQIQALPVTKVGEAQARVLTAERAAARLEYEAKRAAVEKDLYRIQREVEGSDRYRSLELALSLAEGIFPTGQYQLRVPGKPLSVDLTVGYLQPKPDATKNPRDRHDADVPVEHVIELMKAIEAAGIVPDNISIMNRAASRVDGSFGVRGKYYRITINVASEGQSHSFIYNHETGHLFDRKVLDKASPEVKKAILVAYRAGLDTGMPADAALRSAEIKYPGSMRAQFRTLFNEEMLQPGNRNVLLERSNEPLFFEKYNASQGELIAEMFKMHQEQKAITGRGGKPLTYDQLLDHCVKPYSPERADMMRGFGKMYDVLATQAFQTVEPVNSKVAKPAQNSPVDPVKKDGSTGLPPATKP